MAFENRGLEQHEKWIGYAFLVALAQAAITTVLVFVGGVGQSNEQLALTGDPWNLLDAGLLVVLAIGLLAKSRAAAILLLLYFVVSRVFFFVEAGAGLGVLSLAIFYVYAMGVKGCFDFHKAAAISEPDYRPKRGFDVAIVAVLLALMPCMGLGLIIEVVGVPAGYVEARELDADQIDQLRESGLLGADERLEGGVFDGFFDLTEEGNLLTDQHVVSFGHDEQGELWVERFHRASVLGVTSPEPESVLDPYLVILRTEDCPAVRFEFLEREAAERFAEAVRPSDPSD